MTLLRCLPGLATLLALAIGVHVAAPAAEPPRTSAAATRSWTADNGNGTYSNPLFYEEFEDPDVIRVGDDYYLVGTTMHMNPAVQIMHSRDLVNSDGQAYHPRQRRRWQFPGCRYAEPCAGERRCGCGGYGP